MGLRYLTAGESHGQAIAAILEGIPSGLEVRADRIDHELARRQKGYGRGKRMEIENDHIKILSGIRWGRTTGSPICLIIENRDWDNWKDTMSPSFEEVKPYSRMTRPRPGHADLTGFIKYRLEDIRDVIERASARETAQRVAVGAICKIFLEEFGVKIISHVIQIGDIKAEEIPKDPSVIWKKAEISPVRCADEKAEKKMIERIDKAKESGDSLGGVYEIVGTGVPIGLGSYVSSEKRLDGRLAKAVMSIPAIKGVQIGLGFDSAFLPGSRVHDEIFYEPERGFFRKTNNAGGLEGGMSNGEPILIQAVMKPIPTLYNPLRSVDILTKKPFEASVERSDICAVPSASVVGESVTAFEIAQAFLERYAGDSINQLKSSWKEDQNYLKTLF